MNNSQQSGYDAELFGQKFSYPKTGWGALSVIALVAGLCIIIYFLTVKANPKNVNAIFTHITGRVTQEGRFEESSSTYQIQFWTPSAKTKTTKDEELEQWEKIDSDDKLVEFGKVLRADPQITGFRRYEVNGTGITGLKPGTWWVITVRRDYELRDFMKTYRSFWKNDKSIYVEILQEGGRYEK